MSLSADILSAASVSVSLVCNNNQYFNIVTSLMYMYCIVKYYTDVLYSQVLH